MQIFGFISSTGEIPLCSLNIPGPLDTFLWMQRPLCPQQVSSEICHVPVLKFYSVNWGQEWWISPLCPGWWKCPVQPSTLFSKHCCKPHDDDAIYLGSWLQENTLYFHICYQIKFSSSQTIKTWDVFAKITWLPWLIGLPWVVRWSGYGGSTVEWSIVGGNRA